VIRRIALTGTPAHRGAAHGSAYPAQLRDYTNERVALSGSDKWSGRSASTDEMLALAARMLPAHEAYAPHLYEEMVAMATAGDISAEEAVIVGGFTDFTDVVRGVLGVAPQEDNCTAVLVPAAAGEAGQGLYAQTWDMHDTATPYVVMLEVDADPGPAALVFTTIGCVGQIGMNEAGICVGINNLTAAAGQIGVTWPFVVRTVLEQIDLDDAVKAVVDAPLAGAHNFMLMDRTGRGINIEAMPQRSVVTEVTAVPFVHTNHVLDPELAQLEAKRAGALLESSASRLQRGRAHMARVPIGAADLMEMTRDPDAICQVAAPPYNIESCGAAVMRPATGDLWAVWGRPDQNEYESMRVGG
jgi:isopenicillin-N N-acyltransferase-like protein